ncbi:DNA polymerase IV [Zavarzinia aquatilis]|uniref:DNA polymerase IV n=1 Tax=Zavarzinia aquatilis TaxID=2211142 RepID=UPI002435FE0D|nr:DNA polymerase IV [Zavarzinia aquatilis]
MTGEDQQPPPIRKIIHIDMDAFYASVEQRDNPELRGLPVAVGGARARGVVAAASYEARRFGVRSAMPSVTALRKCPDLVFVRPRFDVYRAVSAQIRAIFARYTPLIEPLSLDEAYLDVTENIPGIASATAIAEAIRAEIKAETGLTASAGVSYNKFLAKLASDYRKPDGLFVITPAMGPGFVESLPVGRFHGIGPATTARMNSLGILTGADLRARDLAFLESHFGKAGRHYHGISRGIDHRRVEPDRERKSISAETTYDNDLTSLPAVEAALGELADKVWRHCARHGYSGRTVTIKVRDPRFNDVTRSRTLRDPVGGAAELQAIAMELFLHSLPVEAGIRLLGVGLAALTDGEGDEARQLRLALGPG